MSGGRHPRRVAVARADGARGGGERRSPPTRTAARGERRSPPSRTAARGFTLLEMLAVLTLASVMLAFAVLTFTGYFHRNSARRAAQIFAQDLTAARAFALRSREPVVIRFYESSLWYEVETQGTATAVARRRYGLNGDIDLSGVALDVTGDSLVFSARGIADLSGAPGPLGTATFSSGPASYTVSFNGLGASKVERT